MTTPGKSMKTHRFKLKKGDLLIRQEVGDYLNLHTVPMVIEKIGPQWITFEGDIRISNPRLQECGFVYYGAKWIFYTSIEQYRHELAQDAAFEKLRREVSSLWPYRPNGITLEKINQVRDLLGLA
jgi:hypothetical protein